MLKNKILTTMGGFALGILSYHGYLTLSKADIQTQDKQIVKKVFPINTIKNKALVPKQKIPSFIENSLKDFNMSMADLSEEAWGEFIEKVELQALQKIVFNGTRSKGGDSLIHVLSAKKELDHQLLKELIEKGFDINAKNNIGNTALLMAMQKSANLFDVKALIAMGADILAESNGGRDALAAAFQNSFGPAKREMIDFLVNEQGFSYKNTPEKYLKYMIGDKESLPYIKEILPNLDSGKYKESLDTIAWFGSADDEIVQHFNKNGLEIDHTLLTSMARSENISNETLQKIIDKNNIDINKGSWALGLTPLMSAVESGDSKKVELFLENGANPDIQNAKGNTAFDLANKNPMKAFWVPKEEQIKIKQLLDTYKNNGNSKYNKTTLAETISE